MLQRIQWPTAILLSVVAVVGGFLTYKGIAIPAWVATLLLGGGLAAPGLVIPKGGPS
jgi:hypothetical protein